MMGRLPFARSGCVKPRVVGLAVVPMLSLFLLAALVAGCDNTPVTPSSVAYAQTDLRVGTGTEVVSGATVTVRYTGWLYDPAKTDHKGVIFDTTVGKDAFAFVISTGSVISGWDEGVIGMKVGGIRELVVPPSKAYGYYRYTSIPPNATLLFDIELTDVTLPDTTTTSLKSVR
jgi:FKBP-type peptidyl-prolyl cis-trans isomerase